MSSHSPIAFDPLAVPLRGIHLVEASAGTGKTWAIVSLLLRSIALDGLLIDQVVLVTFTEAATRELRQRVRQRLESALRMIDGGTTGNGESEDHPDLFVEHLLQEARRQDVPPARLRQRVRDALVRCDEAWISTIHALCARWLSEFAFEQGHSLQSWPVGRGDEIQREAVTDIWRRFVVLADVQQAQKILRIESTRDGLLKRLRPLLAAGVEQVDGADSEARLDRLVAMQSALRDEARELSAAGEFARLLEHLGEPGRYSRVSLNAKHLAAAREWLDAAERGTPPDELSPVERVLRSKLQSSLLTKFQDEGVPSLPVLDWLDRWRETADSQPALESVVWLHRLLRAAREREFELQQRDRQLGFDALIRQMRDAIEGFAGAQVTAQLVKKFPLLIVDEFQDTDADQYAIFRAIAKAAPERIGLFLVGDPKQAIYRFRGGDIFAYRQAMQDAETRHSLQHNYRSQRQLVTAVNALFGAATRPFSFDFIEFSAALLPTDREVDDSSSGLIVWLLPNASGPLGKGDADRLVIDGVAAEVAGLVEAGDHRRHDGEAGIAVLVATNRQAGELRDALAALGVASAFAGDQSVWVSSVARALMTVVDALAKPRDSGRQRRAMVGELFELDAAALLADESESVARAAGIGPREAAAQALADARARLLRRGPAAALMPLIADAAGRRLRGIDGRRWVADALHLLDLLDALWTDSPDVHALLQAMQGNIAASGERGYSPDEDERLRPEADQADVVLMTVHGSKGLQFDTVIAPFLWQGAGVAKPASKSGALPATVSYHEDDGEFRFDPGTDCWGLHAELDAQERFAESLRLTYVALTRAKRRAYVVWGEVVNSKDDSRSSKHSALDYLLRGGASSSNVDVDSAGASVGLQKWRDRSGGAVEVRPLPERRFAPIQSSSSEQAVGPRAFRGSLAGRRRIVSYSGLFGGHQDTVRPDRDALPLLADDVLLDAPSDVGGTRFGECAHAALERIDFSRWPSEEDQQQVVQACRHYGFGAEAERYLTERIDVLCKASLIDGLKLGQTPIADRRVELEFFFPLDRASLSGFFEVLQSTPDYARDGPWPGDELSGFMRGFVDLIVRQNDRYYVIDYKTNKLGPTRANYTPSELARSVRQSNYDLQYLVYSLALHRHLAHRLGANYRPEHHLGGVCYVYLRGLDIDGEHGAFVDRPSPELITALDRWAAGAAR